MPNLKNLAWKVFNYLIIVNPFSNLVVACKNIKSGHNIESTNMLAPDLQITPKMIWKLVWPENYKFSKLEALKAKLYLFIHRK